METPNAFLADLLLDIANVEDDLEIAIADADGHSIADLTSELASLKATAAFEAGEITLEEANAADVPDEGIHSA